MKKKEVKPLKYVTEPVFEKHMGSIAKSFLKVDEQLDKHRKILEGILEELKAMRDERREQQMTILDLNHFDVRQERELGDLKIRVEQIERKVK